MARIWTDEDQARFDATVARVLAAKAAELPTMFDCAHCEEPIDLFVSDVWPCPGCGARVCRSCARVFDGRGRHKQPAGRDGKANGEATR